MGSVVLAGATSGSTTLTPTDAVTATITLPSATATLATLGANTFTGNQSITGAVTTTTVAANTATFASVGAAATQTKHFEGTGSTTAAAYGAISNTTGGIVWGVESSAGGQLITGSAAYAGALRAANGLSFSGDGGITLHANINSTGQTLVGASVYYNGAQRFQVAGTAGGGTGDYLVVFANTEPTNPYGAYIKYANASPNDASKYFIDARDSTTARFQVYSNGGIANYSANNVNLSDVREKPVFEDYTEQMLDDLQAKFVKLRRGRFILEGQTHSDWNYGKTAQSVAEHIPELSGIWNPTKRVDVQVEELVDGPFLDASGVPVKVRSFQTKTIEVATPEEEQRLCEYSHDITQIGEALLVRALKRIEDLEARVAALEAK
jgi:hypothetical protein